MSGRLKTSEPPMPSDDTVPVRRETLRVLVDLIEKNRSNIGLAPTCDGPRCGPLNAFVREAASALTAALDPEQNPSFALEIAERELRILTNYVQRTLKLAGCPCPVSLVGCPPDRGLRCRLCDVAALSGETGG